MKNALKDYRNKVYKLVEEETSAYNVLEATLQDWLKRGKLMPEASQKKQILFVIEKKVLNQWIFNGSNNGYLPCKSQMQQMAEEIH